MRFSAIIPVILMTASQAVSAAAQSNSHNVRSAQYKKLIEPLLQVPDFRMHYSEDGAADATVTCPANNDPCPSPPPAVAALMKNPRTTVPLLIDCLSDGRQTSVRFDGNTITRPMQVPVGYVCLDILMAWAGKPIGDYGDCGDGLGACIDPEYYFRPDDYIQCWDESCYPRPWVFVVQRKWERTLKSGLLWTAIQNGSKNPYSFINAQRHP